MYGKIEQVYNLSDARHNLCYYISYRVGGDAEHLYNNLKTDVNVNKHPMFAYFTDRGQLVGFIKGQIASVPNDCFKTFPRDLISFKIDYLYVDDEFHRLGIGWALLRMYEDYVIGAGGQSIFLYSADTKQAKKFYNSQGFKRINRNNPLVIMYGKILVKTK